MKQFFKKSETEVVTLENTSISVKQPRVVIYKEQELTLRFHAQVDFFKRTFFETHIYVPPKIRWENAGPISDFKRSRIINAIIDGLFVLGTRVHVFPDRRSSMLRPPDAPENLQPERLRAIDRGGEGQEESELWNPELPENTFVHASGINIDAYPTPGDPSHLQNLGLTPYECTSRYEKVWSQVEENPSLTYHERSYLLNKELLFITALAKGDLKLFLGPSGLGDCMFLSSFCQMLAGGRSNALTSINSIQLSPHREFLAGLFNETDDQESIKLFLRVFGDTALQGDSARR